MAMEFDYKLPEKGNYIEIQYRNNLYKIKFGYEFEDRAVEITVIKNNIEGCIDFIEDKYGEVENLVLNRESFYLTIRGDVPEEQRKRLEEVVCCNNWRFI